MGGTSLSRHLADFQPPHHREQLWAQGPLGREEGPGTASPSAEPRCVLLFPSAPSIPTQLRLSPSSSTSLVASWAGASGAAWLHLELRSLVTQKVSTTLSARRGLTSYTFQHLHPGTQYWLGLSATAGSHTVVGPNATAWTCEYELGDPSFLPASGPASESKGLLPESWVHRVIFLGPGPKLLQDPALGHCYSGASESLQQVDSLCWPASPWGAVGAACGLSPWRRMEGQQIPLVFSAAGAWLSCASGLYRSSRKNGAGEQQLSWFELEASGGAYRRAKKTFYMGRQ